MFADTLLCSKWTESTSYEMRMVELEYMIPAKMKWVMMAYLNRLIEWMGSSSLNTFVF